MLADFLLSLSHGEGTVQGASDVCSSPSRKLVLLVAGPAMLTVFSSSSPHEWTKFDWKGTKRFRNYLSVITLLTTFLLSELNVFYLK